LSFLIGNPSQTLRFFGVVGGQNPFMGYARIRFWILSYFGFQVEKKPVKF